MTETKRTDDNALDVVQSGNRHWWTSNTMSYDWKESVEWPRYSQEWFDEIDRRFVHAARLFATDRQPFDRMIPFESLAGKRVLEIGCGMGYHTELLARAGAVVTSIDISPTSVEATTRRLAVRGLRADVGEADAEFLPFEKGSFDFVWSWGVIHHSSRTALIVRRVSEVLRQEGEARVMVYNREGASAWTVLLWDYLVKAGFRKSTFDELLWSRSVSDHRETRVSGQQPRTVVVIGVLHRGPSRGQTRALRRGKSRIGRWGAPRPRVRVSLRAWRSCLASAHEEATVS